MQREAVPPIEISDEPASAGRPTRYRAKIDRVSPLTRRSTFEQLDTCFLGVSLENSNFIRPKLHGILEWIARRFQHCTVLIGDSIHRITLETTRGLGADAALAEGLRLGATFLEEERDVFAEFAAHTQFSFVRCSEVQAQPQYAAYHGALVELYQREAAFRASVESFGREYHNKHSAERGPAERAWLVQRSSAYFLEEFAIFACLRRLGIEVMVYPGSFSTLAEIAAGDHPGAPRELHDLVVVSLHLRGR